ncbi:hypothetical protein H0H92_010940 [Tricholoma furcatifolium]|nr:hypothetical protein H0H92_010940 [Tricholoma furcatifolium]
MLTPRRYIAIVLVVVLSLHFFLALVVKDYGALTARISEQLRMPPQTSQVDTSLTTSDALQVYEEPRQNSTNFTYQRRANATFVLLCRNRELNGVVSSIQQMEDRFNRYHNYPWVLLNEEPFTEEFKKRVSVLTDAPISFGLIPKEHWFQPDWIDEIKAREGRTKMMWQGIIYAGSVPYRNMCRFNSGSRVCYAASRSSEDILTADRPDVKFFCDVPYDPFLYMEDNDKIYEFIAEHPEYVAKDNSMGFLSDNDGESYNLCHCYQTWDS